MNGEVKTLSWRFNFQLTDKWFRRIKQKTHMRLLKSRVHTPLNTIPSWPLLDTPATNTPNQ